MGRKKVAPAGGKQIPADDLLRLLHSQNLGKIRTVVKSGLDPNGYVSNTSCFDNTTWVLRDQKPLVPLLIFSCFNGAPAPAVDLLIRLGASADAVTDCGLPAPLAVLCAKITPEEQRALFQVLRHHHCSTFNASMRSARNDLPIHVTCKILDLSDWPSPRKVEGIELLIQFGTFQLPDGSLDERAMYEFLATAVRHPCGHKLLDCIWRHFPQRLLPSLPVSDCLLLRALTDSWLEPIWRHSEERQHIVSMGLVLRALLEHPALEKSHREAVACWLRANMTVLLYHPELVASLLDRCKAPAEGPNLRAENEGKGQPAPPTVVAAGDANPSAAGPCPGPLQSPLFFHPDDRDLVLPTGLLSGPEAAQGTVPLSPNMSLMLAYVVDADEQLARQGVRMLLSRGARVDLPCRLGSEVLGSDCDGQITPLMAAFMPYHRNQGLVELLWQRFAEIQPALATQEAAIRMRSAAHTRFLSLPGWQAPLDSAARAAAAAAAMSAAKTGGAGGAADGTTAAATICGSPALEASPLDCSRERLRDLLDSNVLDYVDNRNLELVEAALTGLLTQLSSLSSQPAADPQAAPAASAVAVSAKDTNAQGNSSSSRGGGAAADLAEQVAVISERLERAQARLDQLYGSDRSEVDLADDPEVWRAEAEVEALAAVHRCLQRLAASAARAASTCYELPGGVAFVEVIAARIVGQPEWGFSRGLLLQLGLSQMRRVLRALQAGGGGGTAAAVGVGAEGGVQGVIAQMEVLRLYYDDLLGSMSGPEQRLLEDLVSALQAAEEERDLEEEEQQEMVDVAAKAAAITPKAAATAAAAVACPGVTEGPLVKEDGVKVADSSLRVDWESLEQRLSEADKSPLSPKQQHQHPQRQGPCQVPGHGQERVGLGGAHQRDEQEQGQQVLQDAGPRPQLHWVDSPDRKALGAFPQDGASVSRDVADGRGNTVHPVLPQTSACDNSIRSRSTTRRSCSGRSSSNSTVGARVPNFHASALKDNAEAEAEAGAEADAVVGWGMAGFAIATADVVHDCQRPDSPGDLSAVVAQGFLSPQAREAMHRAMLPGELIGDWTSDDDAGASGDEDEDRGDYDDADGNSAASGGGSGSSGGGGCSDSSAPSSRLPVMECGVTLRGMDGGVAVHKFAGSPRKRDSRDSSSGGGSSGVDSGVDRKGKANGRSSERGQRVSDQGKVGLGLQGDLPLQMPPLQQQPRRHLKGSGAVSNVSNAHCVGRRRVRRLYDSDCGANQPEGFSTPIGEGWRDPELLLGGFNVMSLPPNVRHGTGGGDGSCSSSDSDREFEQYAYMGAAVMLQNDDNDSASGDGVVERVAGSYGSAESSAYDTPSEGSGDDDVTSLLEAQVRACSNSGAAAAAAVSRRLSAGGDASSGESYGSAQGRYGSAHGYGPEYGLESVGGDTGALEYGGENHLSGGGGSGDGDLVRGGIGMVGPSSRNKPLIAVVANLDSATSDSTASLLLPPPPQHRATPGSRLGSDQQQRRRNGHGNGQHSKRDVRHRPLGHAAAAFSFGDAAAAAEAKAEAEAAKATRETSSRDSDPRGAQWRGVRRTAISDEGSTSSSASVNFMPRPPVLESNLLPLRTKNPTALTAAVAATSTATAIADGGAQNGDTDGAAAAAIAAAYSSFGGVGGSCTCSVTQAVDAGLGGVLIASASVSCTSSSSSALGAAGASSGRSSLDSTRAYIVHKPSADAAGDESRRWYRLWTNSRELDRDPAATASAAAAAVALPPQQGRPHRFREASPTLNRCGGDSGDEYVHTYDCSYECVNGGGGDGEARSNTGVHRAQWRRNANSGSGDSSNGGSGGGGGPSSCRPGAAGSPTWPTGKPWGNGRRRNWGVGISAGCGAGCANVPAAADAVRDSSAGEGGPAAAVAIVAGENATGRPTAAGYAGQPRRRVVVRRTHAAPGPMAAAGGAVMDVAARNGGADAAWPALQRAAVPSPSLPLPQPPQPPQPPRRVGRCSCSTASEGSAMSSARGRRQCSGSNVSYGSQGSVTARLQSTIGRVRAASLSQDGSNSGDEEVSDGSVGIDPRCDAHNWRLLNCGRDGSRKGNEGRGAMADSTSVCLRSGCHFTRAGDADADVGDTVRRQRPIHDLGGGSGGGGSGGGGGAEGYCSDDASSTSTQEWPPRRNPAGFGATTHPTRISPGSGDAATAPAAAIATDGPTATAAGALGTPAAEVIEPWMRTPPRHRRGLGASDQGDSDSPGSVGFSGRGPDYSSGSDSSSETESSSVYESDGDNGGGRGHNSARWRAVESRPPPLRSESDSDPSSSALPVNMRFWNTSSSNSSVTSRPTPATSGVAKRPGTLPGMVGAAAVAASAAAQRRFTTAADHNGALDAGTMAGAAATPKAHGVSRNATAAASTTASAAAAAAAAATTIEKGAGDGDGGFDADADSDDSSPGVSGRRDSLPGSPVVLSLFPPPSPTQPGRPASSLTSPATPQPQHLQQQQRGEVGQQQQQQQRQQQASLQADSLMRAPPLQPAVTATATATTTATATAGAAATSSPSSVDRTLFALLNNLATSANVFPRQSLELFPNTGVVTRPGCSKSAWASGTGPDAVGALRTAAGNEGGRAQESSGGGAGLQDCYVLHLSGATPDAEAGCMAPPAVVTRVLATGPSCARALYSWAAELRAALVAASGCESQRLFVVADTPARRWPAWLLALRAAIVSAVVGPALDSGGGAKDERFGGRQSDRPTGRRHCPEWLRQTVLLLPLCHLIVPYGGAYLYQAASRACQESGSSPAAVGSSGRCRTPRLWLDAECLAAAAAFAEAYPGNMYGRAILMLYVDRQVSRTLLRSPRYGLRVLARSAETLTEVLYGCGGGGGSGATATATAATWLYGPMGQHPAAAQALLLLASDDDDGGDGDGDSGMSGREDGEGSARDDTDGEESRALRAASVTCHVLGSALNATRQMQTVWRATWPGGHSLRLACYSYLAATGYPRAVVSALNWCVPLVLDGVADLSELLSEIRLLSFNATTALMMAEEIFVSQQYGDGAFQRRTDGAATGFREDGGGEDEEADGLSMGPGSDTAVAFEHLVNALRASVAPCPQPQPADSTLRPKLQPWSQLCTAQREQLVDELLTLADLLMIAHAVLLTLRTALSYAADGGAAAMSAAAGALRREVAEVQMMRAAASRMLVERMELQERSPEPLYYNHPYNYHNPHQQNGQQNQPYGLHVRQPTSSVALKGTAVGQAAARNQDAEDRYGGDGGDVSRDGGGADGALCGEEELQDWLEDGVSWRHVNGLYEHGKTVLQCAADAAAVLLDSEARADNAARCDRLVTALHEDQQLLEGLNALATMPSHHHLPLAPWDPAAAAEAAEAAAASASGSGGEGAASDPVLQAAVNAAAAAASFSQCNEVLYRLLVLPWDDGGDGDNGGDGDVCTSLAGEFERSSWSIPTLLSGDFRPLTQLRVRRLYDEVRCLAAECLEFLPRKALSGAGLVTRGGLAGDVGDWADGVTAPNFREDVQSVDKLGHEQEQEQSVKEGDLRGIAAAAIGGRAVVAASAAVEVDGYGEGGDADGGVKEEEEEVEGLDDPA